MRSKLYIKQTGFVEKTVGNEMVVVPLVGTVAQMEKVFSLNEIGSFIYNNLGSKKSTGEITELILNEFEIDRETAQKDVEQFLEKAVANGVIKEL
ncbi:PqqD family protein [Carboxylicivirga sp. RSCT41]|uniref:PqqD family protein n=1 Tax=Carboxylicivirga agarovorans TaxID=3417570 RepID=UPI003D32FE16